MSSLFPLRPLQQNAMDLLRASIRNSSALARPVRTVIQAPCGFGKCLGRGTPVMKFDGTVVAVEDIVPGDNLMGPDSSPRRVMSVCSGSEMLYRVTPIKGDPYVVNESHILSFKIGGGCSKEKNPGRLGGLYKGKIVNIGVIDYLSSSATFKGLAKAWRPAIDFDGMGEQLKIDPYFMGLWLGDGYSRHATICTGDKEVSDYVEAYAASLGLVVRAEKNSENSVNLHLRKRDLGAGKNAVYEALCDYGLVMNKHVPLAYKRASRADRLELLAGVMDTDGYLIANGGYGLTLKSEALMDGIIFVARSLGFSAFKRKIEKTCGNNGAVGEYWRCSINGPVDSIPCRIPRKKSSPRRQTKDHLLVGIESVEAIGVGEYFGFEISGDRLFLLGDFTVTHNTVIGAHIIDGALRKGNRIAFLVPMLSLIEQSFERFMENGIAPGDMGIMQGDHPMRRPHAPIQICSVQTLASRGFPPVKTVLVDECHLRFKTLDKWMHDRPEAIFIGLSATPWSKGMGNEWNDLVIPTTIRDLIDLGWLSKFRVFAASHPDLSGVKTIAGDYHEGELAAVMSGKRIIADVVANWIEKGEGRPTLCFGVDRAHAALLHEQFEGVGVASAYVDGLTPRSERLEIISRFQSGEIKIIHSVGTMTTGVDVDCRCVILARPTKSEILFVQMMGRGLRTAAGKEDCLIFDHTDTTLNLGMVTDIHHDRLRTAKTDAEEKAAAKDAAAPPVPRECPQCHMLIPVRTPVCPGCGFKPVKVSGVVCEDGELTEYGAKKAEAKRLSKLSAAGLLAEQGKQAVYSQLLAMQGGKSDGWVAHKYKAVFEVWPKGLSKVPVEPTQALRLWVHSENIKWAKSRPRPDAAAAASDQADLANAA